MLWVPRRYNMDFLSAKEYIDGLSRYGSVLGLENIESLLERLDNPQDKLNVIHVAGTNGKGSTITYIEEVLLAAGYKVARYSSPVVFEYLEKYKINGENISEEAFTKAVEEVKPHIEYLNGSNITPTIFEVETALAFKIFADEKVDAAIIETGMGGDLDATNVCKKPLLSVITSISYDHMAFLGNTIKEIAAHKAGIIKENVPVAANGCNDEAISVIKSTASEKNSSLWISGRADLEKGIYIASKGKEFNELNTKMIGSYQSENVALAIESILALNDNYSSPKGKICFNISDELIKEGIKNAFLPGRFEKISETPLVYIDGAHNPDAIIKLKATLESNFKEATKLFIMGVLADKDYEKECGIICGLADEIITITPNNNRGLDGRELAKVIAKYNKNVSFCGDMKEACEKVKGAGKELTVAFGSLSYLGEFKKCFID